MLRLEQERDTLKEQVSLYLSELHRYKALFTRKDASQELPVDMSRAQIHIAFLFSSPLVRSTQNRMENILQIDYKSEIVGIKRAFKLVQNQIKFKCDVATKGNLSSIISSAPVALHFSGHGVENTD